MWKNSSILRKKIYDLTARFPRLEVKRICQMRDAARSVKQNIQEGYSRKSLAEYIRGLDIGKGSLAELMGDLDDCVEDGLMTQNEYKELDYLCKKTHYLFDRLLTALRQKRRELGQ